MGIFKTAVSESAIKIELAVFSVTIFTKNYSLIRERLLVRDHPWHLRVSREFFVGIGSLRKNFENIENDKKCRNSSWFSANF